MPCLSPAHRPHPDLRTYPVAPEPPTLGSLLDALERGEALAIRVGGAQGREVTPAGLAELGHDLVRLGLVLQHRAAELDVGGLDPSAKVMPTPAPDAS